MDFSEVIQLIQDGKYKEVEAWSNSLVNADVDSDVDAQFGATALQWACHHNQPLVAKVLLDKGADPNLTNAYDATALHWAVKTGSLPLVRLLCEYEADKSLTNAAGQTAAQMAEQMGAAEIVDFLIPPVKPKVFAESLTQQTLQPVPIPQRSPMAPVTNTASATASALSAREEKDKEPSHHPTPPANMYKGSRPPPASLTAKDLETYPSPSKDLKEPLSTLSRATSRTSEYQPSLHSQVSTAGVVPALQRAKAKLEMELKNSQALVEELRKDANTLQIQNLQLDSKVKAQEEIKKKMDALHKEKMAGDRQLKQATADFEAKLKRVEANLKGELEAEKADAERRIAALQRDRKQAVEEAQTLRAGLDKARQEKTAVIAQKDAAMDELRTEIHSLQSDKVRMEVEVKGSHRTIVDLRGNISDLEKDVAILKVEAATVPELKEAMAELQHQKSEMETKLETAEAVAESEKAAQEAATKKMEHSEKKLAEQVARFTELKASTDALTLEHKQSVADNRKLTEQLHNVENEMARLKKRHEDEINQVPDEEFEQSKKAFAALQESWELLKEEKQAVVDQLKDAEDQAIQSQARLRQAEKTIEENQERVSHADRLENANRVLEKVKASLQEQLERKEGQLEEMNKKFHSLAREKASLDGELQDALRLKPRLDKVEKEKFEIEVQMKQAQLKAGELGAQVEALQSEKATLDEQLSVMDDLREAYEKLGRDNDIALERVRMVEAEKEKALKDHRQAEEDQRNADKRERNALEQKLQYVEQEKNSATTEMRSLVEQLMQAQNTIAEMTQTHVRERGSALQQIQARIEQLNKVKKLEAEKAEAEEEARHQASIVAQLQQLVEIMNNDKTAVDQHMRGKEHQMNHKDQEMKQLTALAVDLKSRIKALEKELESERYTRKRELDAQRHQFEHENERLRNQANDQLDQYGRQYQDEMEKYQRHTQMLEKQKQGLEMQIKALQDQAALAAATAPTEPRTRPVFERTERAHDSPFKSRFDWQARDDGPRKPSKYPSAFMPEPSVLDKPSWNLSHSGTLDDSQIRDTLSADGGAAAKLLPPLPPKSRSDSAPQPYEIHRLPKASAFAREQRTLMRKDNK